MNIIDAVPNKTLASIYYNQVNIERSKLVFNVLQCSELPEKNDHLCNSSIVWFEELFIKLKLKLLELTNFDWFLSTRNVYRISKPFSQLICVTDMNAL